MQKWVALVLVALVIGASALAFRHRAAVAGWEAEVKAGLAAADSATAVAARAIAEKDELELEVSRLTAELEEQGRRRAQRVVAVRQVVVPDTCAPFVLPRDTLIDELSGEVEGWKQAFQKQLAATAEMEVAFGAVSESNTTLRRLLEERPKPRPAWIPTVGVGAFAGVTTEGKPAMGVGMTATWEVPF